VGAVFQRQVDGALTYGEYDLGHFCALVVRLRN
jgi:hypothetical protein